MFTNDHMRYGHFKSDGKLFKIAINYYIYFYLLRILFVEFNGHSRCWWRLLWHVSHRANRFAQKSRRLEWKDVVKRVWRVVEHDSIELLSAAFHGRNIFSMRIKGLPCQYFLAIFSIVPAPSYVRSLDRLIIASLQKFTYLCIKRIKMLASNFI